MFNKVILVGNLSRDIELRYTQGGTAIANTGIATNRKFKKQSGELVEEVMFIDITFIGRSAEIANQYLRKGSKCLIDGRLKLEQWTDQNGQKRSKHVVMVEEMKMLDGHQDGQQQGGYNPQQQREDYRGNHGAGGAYQADQRQGGGNQPPEIDIDEDEIPF